MKIICIPFAGALGSALILLSPAAEAGNTKETTLHAFGSGKDGAYASAGVIELNGMLYGTTIFGGSNGYGAVYTLDPKTGAESVLYSFCSQQNCKDGKIAAAGLIDVGGLLYGTTAGGGTYGDGTVFALDPKNGAEAVLYSSCSRKNCSDGRDPEASLIDVKGMLYGTTLGGGKYSYGTVYAIDPKTGAETVLYSFCGQRNCKDGETPYASLIDVKGVLFGTTAGGGANGYGTVFALDPNTGTETALYSFCSQQNCEDGEDPEASLIDVKGTLYSTTYYGGAHNAGTVFALDPNTGAETVLYSFCRQSNCKDGDNPEAGLIDVNGTLYGTTQFGGTSAEGAVFALNAKTGSERMIYSFCSQPRCTDGQSPYAGLIDINGALYGTTFEGGTHKDGTVFVLKNP